MFLKFKYEKRINIKNQLQIRIAKNKKFEKKRFSYVGKIISYVIQIWKKNKHENSTLKKNWFFWKPKNSYVGLKFREKPNNQAKRIKKKKKLWKTIDHF